MVFGGGVIVKKRVSIDDCVLNGVMNENDETAPTSWAGSIVADSGVVMKW